MATAIAAPASQREPGQRFVLADVDWATYRQFAQALRRRHVRLTYDRGVLEFMTKSIWHGRLSRLLGQFVLVLAEVLGLPRCSCGDMTVDREDLDRGAELDECYYLAHESHVRDKKIIDLATDPPPDLVIEIDIRRSSQRRLSIYAALRVPEVWQCDGTLVRFQRLQPDGNYAPAAVSGRFPILAAADLTTFLEQWSHTEEGQLVDSFRAFVRAKSSGSETGSA